MLVFCVFVWIANHVVFVLDENDWLTDGLTEWSLPPQSACELIRLKKSGLAAEAEDTKPTDDVKCRGTASWPGELGPIYKNILRFILSLSYDRLMIVIYNARRFLLGVKR